MMRMWKKICAVTTAGALCLAGAPPLRTALPEAEIAVSAESYGELTYDFLEDGTIAITGCDTSVTEVEIPGEIDGVAVTSIGNSALYHCENLISVTIPDSVVNIGLFAFSECTCLTSINIPDSVTSIGAWAFEYCSDLINITIPDSVTNIGEGAFSGCTSLTAIDVPESNSAYCSVDGVLFDKEQTKLICCPGGKSGAYTIPDSVTSIGWYAFEWCENLTSITIPDNVTYIEGSAFTNCDSLMEIMIPDSVTSIGSYAFAGCTNLTNITIPNVIGIDEGMFKVCSSLTSVTIPDSVTFIDQGAFCFCTSLTDVYYDSTEEEWNTITIMGENESLQSATIHCSDGDITPAPPVATETTEPPIATETTESPAVTDIGLTYDFLEDGTIEITGCDTDMTAVEIPGEIDGVAVTSIGDSAFYDCTSLTCVIIPDSVTSIGFAAFDWCENLTSITIPDSVTSIGAWAFNGTPWLTEKQTENPLVIVNHILIDGMTCEGDVIIPDDVTSIGNQAFYECYDLETVIISESVKTIGDFAFQNCNNLTSVIISNGLTSIGAQAFWLCDNLSDVTIPDSVTSISFSAFADTPWLNKKITENPFLLAINGNLLIDGRYCEGAIVIPSYVTIITEGAFYCYSGEDLTDVYFEGTEEEWNAIEIADYNDSLVNATIHFNYDGTPSVPALVHDAGDLDGDSKITMTDAYQALIASSRVALGQDNGLTNLQFAAADVDGDGRLTMTDAYWILMYSSYCYMGQEVTWDALLGR